MTIRQFQEWRAYAELEPFDETRDDVRTAQVVAALYNIFTRQAGDKVHEIREHVIPFGKQPEKPKAQESTLEERQQQVFAVMRDLMAVHNPPDKQPRLAAKV